MGYFKQEMIEDHEDLYRNKRVAQLRERLQELDDRLEELNYMAANNEPGWNEEAYLERYLYTEDDLRAVLPKHMKSVVDVSLAADYVRKELKVMQEAEEITAEACRVAAVAELSDHVCRRPDPIYLDLDIAV